MDHWKYTFSHTPRDGGKTFDMDVKVPNILGEDSRLARHALKQMVGDNAAGTKTTEARHKAFFDKRDHTGL